MSLVGLDIAEEAVVTSSSSLDAANRPLGLWMTTALVVGNMIGAGVFLLPASLAAYGGIGLLGWVFTGFGAIMLSLVFARLSRHYPRSGGPYAYSRYVFGDFLGFQLAWSYWTANWVSNAAVAIAFVSYLSIFLPQIHSDPWLSLGAGLGLVWILTYINAVSVKAAGKMQLVATILKLIPLGAIAIFGLFTIHPEHFTPFNPTKDTAWGAINSAATLALFAFVGLESGTVPAENIENPTKTIPRATVLGTSLAALIYILVMISVMGAVPPGTLASSKTPLVDAAMLIFGPWAGPLVAGGAVISCLGTLNGWILLQGQVPLAAAQDGLFPSVFLKVSKSGIPVFGLVFSSILVSLLLWMNFGVHLVDQFTMLVTLTTFAMLMPYLYSSMADLMVMVGGREKLSTPRFIRAISVSCLAFSYSLWAAYGAGQEVVFLGTIFMLGGIPIYVIMRKEEAKRFLEKQS